MSFDSGRAPRRLLQTHGAFINATLTPRLRSRRAYGQKNDKPIKNNTTIAGNVNAQQANKNKRLNEIINFVSNDEVFDVREGEICIYSQEQSGFPNHRRGVLFSSLNGLKAQADDTSLEDAVAESDFRFVGLCQNSYISSNTQLQSQGFAVQTSGIKTIINQSEATINIGDRLMCDVMRQVPSKPRKGIPNEKVTLILRKVPKNYVPKQVKKAVQDSLTLKTEQSDFTDDAAVKKYSEELRDNVIAKTILELRKQSAWVVGVAMNAARAGEQLDVLLTKPSFV